MKRVFCTLFVVVLSCQVSASIQLQVCDSNSLTPLDLREVTVGYDPNTFEAITQPEVMVGSTVSILVYSDSNNLWSGGFFIKGQDRTEGQLTARDGGLSRRCCCDVNSLPSDPNQYYSGSCLEAAGEYAYILDWSDSKIAGFDCYTDDFKNYPGYWFVLDYTALKMGSCEIGFYDHSEDDWSITDPNLSIQFQNTPTRDLEPDGVVNYLDFTVFAACWNEESETTDPNFFSPADFSLDGYVGLDDVVMFADYWMWGLPGWQLKDHSEQEQETYESVVYDVSYSLICDPNASPFTDPNSLSDANSLSEITLEVGDSVTIYLDKSSTYDEVYILDMEVTISDPNLGTIDNDPNGTAEILAYPRFEIFDDIGAGYEQPEGIAFFTGNVEPILDGDMASFVYTATAVGNVELNLINYYASPGAYLNPIVIHQVRPVLEILEEAYEESEELQESVTQEEWDAFIESVEVSTQE